MYHVSTQGNDESVIMYIIIAIIQERERGKESKREIERKVFQRFRDREKGL